jgi:lipoyl(octanoyl) transferase
MSDAASNPSPVSAVPDCFPEPAIQYYLLGEEKKEVHVDWGLTRYRDAYARQLEWVQKRVAGEIPDTLIFNTHHPVYTIGRHKDAARHLCWDEAMLAQQGIEVEETNRGGDITYHGPGQIVGYPIISLTQTRDLHRYLRDLEECLIRTLWHYGLETSRREGMTGIWIGKRKIAAMGIAIRHWITYHGFALNVNPDLRHFQGIVPCGIVDGTVTSMEEELGYVPEIPTLKHLLAVEFWGIFTNYGNPCSV